MRELANETHELELGDPYEIPYSLLPLAPAPSTRQPSLWELFLLGLRPSAPYFPLGRSEGPPHRRGD